MGRKCHKLKLYYLTSELISGSSVLDFPNGSKIINRECPIYGSFLNSKLFSLDTSKLNSKKLNGSQTISIPGMGDINYSLTVDYEIAPNGVTYVIPGTYVYQIVSGSGKFLGVKGTITTTYTVEDRQVTIRYYK